MFSLRVLALLVLPLLVALGTIYSCLCLLQNYRKARQIGLPIRIIPICHTNVLWTLVDRRVIAIARKLPFGENSFTRFNYRGWELDDLTRSHDEMGPAYVLVSPRRNWLYVADPGVLTDIFRRRVDFPRCLELTEMLNVFGPNMSTVDGDQWKAQRKLTATFFNDQNNEIVWSETLRVAKDVLQYWTKQASHKTAAPDLRTLSLHVLSRAAFGRSFEFEGHGESNEASALANEKEALQMILENCVLIMILGTKFLAKPWLPRKLRQLHEACQTFQSYMTEIYEREKRAYAEGRSTGRNLMTSLVRASQDDSTKAGAGLTETEIYGNMFVINFAGHDTTAHTFTFALYLLAANPDVQAWVREEVREVCGGRPVSELDYAKDFPRLRRCLSLMMETLRLYTPVPTAKWTSERFQSLAVGDKTVMLPPETMVIPSHATVHMEAKYWGPEPLSWRPSRWIQTSSKAPAALGDEELMTPQRGTFLAWSEGARDCIGRKFSQVEFVATIAMLLRDWEVNPVTMEGESLKEAQKRVLHLIETDSRPILLLQMLHPERAPLVWKRCD
ncbi:cytochrome P450 [Xylariomycetidae sp. FL2044]|nr:cytochrome P450 [Xylariomycetidae sp. FL2044]